MKRWWNEYNGFLAERSAGMGKFAKEGSVMIVRIPNLTKSYQSYLAVFMRVSEVRTRYVQTGGD